MPGGSQARTPERNHHGTKTPPHATAPQERTQEGPVQEAPVRLERNYHGKGRLRAAFVRSGRPHGQVRRALVWCFGQVGLKAGNALLQGRVFTLKGGGALPLPGRVVHGLGVGR